MPDPDHGPAPVDTSRDIVNAAKPVILITITLGTLLFSLFSRDILRFSRASAFEQALGSSPATSLGMLKEVNSTAVQQLTPPVTSNERGGNKVMPRYRVTISGPSNLAMSDLVRKYKIQVSDHGIHYVEGTGFLVDAIVQPEEIQLLEAAGYKVQRHEDVDEVGKARQAEVGQGNRYKRPGPR